MLVKIMSDRSYGTKVLTEDGAPLECTDVVFRAAVDDFNRAEITLSLVEINAEAEARVYVNGREVRRIEYVDGTADEYPAS